MKKTLLLAGAALSIFTAANANAKTYIGVTPYVGLDYTYSKIGFSNGLNRYIENDSNVFSVVGGGKFNDYVGVEGFIQRANRADYRQTATKFTSNHWAIGADVLGYLPVYQDLELIGGIGLGEYRFIAREVGQRRKTHTDGAHGVRFTVGAQYNLDYNWGIRASYRYVNYTSSDVNRTNEYSIGVRYSF